MTGSEQQRIFEHWLEGHKALLFKVTSAYAFSEADRDDLFQEISVQVWRSVPNFRAESTVTTWLYRVALNTAIKWVRKEQKHYDGKHSFDNIGYLLHETGKQPDQRLPWLYEEIGKLDKIERSVTLLMLDGFSYREISDILGISDSNVGVKIHRIKKHLIQQSEKFEHYGI